VPRKAKQLTGAADYDNIAASGMVARVSLPAEPPLPLPLTNHKIAYIHTRVLHAFHPPALHITLAYSHTLDL
jgi:hypothetical protein